MVVGHGDMAGVSRALVCVAGVLLAAPALAEPPQRIMGEAEYRERLHGMWLGEAIANWTGIPTEGQRQTAPFFTDADGPAWVNLVLGQNPWLADDDTDIESAYLAMMYEFAPGWTPPPASLPPGFTPLTRLNSAQIAQGWTSHINRFIWVSNASARTLITRGVAPPSTSLAVANPNRLMIDAQLTTEFFGALCPGMPERALDMASLPIRTTASGYAEHASQFYVVLYSLATQTDRTLPMRDQILWMYARARQFIPDSSKSADIADFVLADYLANPDVNNWELTRDRVYQRYQLNAAANGFRWRAWYESSVNFAGGLIALLYGEGDFERTVQIGALSGWDSDNGTATMGGLLGLMKGYDPLVAEIRAAHPSFNPSDRFDIARTRDAMPDYLPADAAAHDTLSRMSERMIPIARREVLDAGGLVDAEWAGGARWMLPRSVTSVATPDVDALVWNPSWREHVRSTNFQVRSAGGSITPSSSLPPSTPQGTGVNWTGAFVDGIESAGAGLEENDLLISPYTTRENLPAPGVEVRLTVMYDRPVTIDAIRFVEGDHFYGTGVQGHGGWFDPSVSLPVCEVFDGVAWSAPAGAYSDLFDSAHPFQIIDWVLQTPVQARGIRIRGLPGGTHRFVTCAELDALSPSAAPLAPTYDLDADGRVDVEDLYQWGADPVDLNGDDSADEHDRAILAQIVRWMERHGMMSGR